MVNARPPMWLICGGSGMAVYTRVTLVIIRIRVISPGFYIPEQARMGSTKINISWPRCYESASHTHTRARFEWSALPCDMVREWGPP